MISRLETLIHTGDDYSLFRINPIQYAKEKGFEEQESIDLFLHGVIAGIFQMNWHLLCPGCTMVLDSFSSLSALDSRCHCEICNVDSEATLDDYIMISFTVAPDIREIVFNHPETLSDTDYISMYRFSKEGMTREGTRWLEQAMPFLKVHSYIQQEEAKKFTADIAEGYLVISDLLNHLGTIVPVTGGAGGGESKIGITLNGVVVKADRDQIPAGKASFEFHNGSAKRGLVTVLNLPPDYQQRFSINFSPYLSGKKLLTTQSFRDLFHREVVKGTDGLGVKDISIVFTDLKGSTSLYERIGDLNAYSLVRQHFDILGSVITRNSGAIVKTIGDAVMGSFMNPADAVKAAIEMNVEVAGMNKSPEKKDLILKIGIHKGASIVVNLNDRLDYFGQMVNIAARVQDLAAGDEIYVTSDIYDYPGVRDMLTSFKVVPGKAKLKGVLDEMQVYRISAIDSGRIQ